MAHKASWPVAIALAIGCYPSGPGAAGAAEQQPTCALRLALTFTPDVPNAQDPGFLGAILSSPQYRLAWVSGTDTQATVDLTGPGPISQCQNAVEKLSRDAHVLDVQVLPPGGMREVSSSAGGLWLAR